MGNHKMGHRQTRINLTSLKTSKTIVAEIWRQPIGINVIKSLNVVIITIGVETVVAPNTNVVKSGILIGYATNLDHGLGGVSIGRNLTRSLGLLVAITRVVATP
jgi:hypothetical protein